MRETIDFGIDLGTTNSAIAVAEDDGVRVIKNNDGWDFTPSAVWIPKEGVIHVGRRARERTETDPGNAYAEFKLEMGAAGAGRLFERTGVTLTPEELSAEVLKSLRQDAAHEYGHQPAAAVITVPASFALNQNNATGSAAALAGLGEHCPLVQEPTAAAIAYGVQDASESAHWMVFDLGGGTFDAALMSKRDGELQLIQHAGDPYLGGKLIDWALVDDLLAPAVRRDLGLADFNRNNRGRWRKNFAKLKLEAENAKIALSRAGSVEISVDLDDGNGGTEPFEYTLTRGALDDLALPFYTRAVRLCREALADSSLRPDHIDRLLLVGGATLSPACANCSPTRSTAPASPSTTARTPPPWSRAAPPCSPARSGCPGSRSGRRRASSRSNCTIRRSPSTPPASRSPERSAAAARSTGRGTPSP